MQSSKICVAWNAVAETSMSKRSAIYWKKSSESKRVKVKSQQKSTS